MQHLLNQIHNMDCLELLKQLPNASMDCIITDPPYLNTDYDYDQDAKEFSFELWAKEIFRVSKDNTPILIFSNVKFMLSLLDIQLLRKYFRYELIWVKPNKAAGFLNAKLCPLINHEFILVFAKTLNKNTVKYNHGVKKLGEKKYENVRPKIPHYVYRRDLKLVKSLNDKPFPNRIFTYNKFSGNQDIKSIHPSEKPFSLIQRLVELYSNENDIVLDTFSGSGVLAKVCMQNKRNFICTEISKEFYDKSIESIGNDLFTEGLY